MKTKILHETPARRRRSKKSRSLYSVIALSMVAASLSLPLLTVQEAAPAFAAPVNNGTNDETAPIVNLFQWNWNSVAQECTVLGPRGVKFVQISVPTEHVVVPGNPWWQDYQPVSYKLDSRRGTEAELQSMITACNNAGVKVIADVVINHMAGTSGSSTVDKVGYAGSDYRNLEYPEVPWVASNFHNPCEITNWGNREQVYNCQSGTGADLKTEEAAVRAKIKSDLITPLIDMGVAGFRIDAAKHMRPDEIADIVGDAYVYQEVIGGGNNVIKPSEYTQVGDVTEFSYYGNVSNAFSSNTLGNLRNINTSLSTPSSSAVVFIDNHDTERNSSWTGVSHQDGASYNLANVFMLTYGYGRPVINSSYNYSDVNDSPPSDASGATSDTVCGDGSWVCQHRDDSILNAVQLNSDFKNSNVTQWQTLGSGSAVSFSRGGYGHVVINNGNSALTTTVPTDLEPGEYFDVIAGDGSTFTVSNDKTISITVPAKTAVATSYLNREDGTVVANPSEGVTKLVPVAISLDTARNKHYDTHRVYDYFITGNHSSLGSWEADNALMIGDTNNSIVAKVSLPPGDYELKMLWRETGFPNQQKQWVGGDNARFTVEENAEHVSISAHMVYGSNTTITTTTSYDIGMSMTVSTRLNSSIPWLCQTGYENCDGGYAGVFRVNSASINQPASSGPNFAVLYNPSPDEKTFIPRYGINTSFGQIDSSLEGTVLTPRLASDTFTNCVLDNSNNGQIIASSGASIQGLVFTCDEKEIDVTQNLNDSYTIEFLNESEEVVSSIDGYRTFVFDSSAGSQLSFDLEICENDSNTCVSNAPPGSGGWQRFSVVEETQQVTKNKMLRILGENNTSIQYKIDYVSVTDDRIINFDPAISTTVVPRTESGVLILPGERKVIAVFDDAPVTYTEGSPYGADINSPILTGNVEYNNMLPGFDYSSGATKTSPVVKSISEADGSVAIDFCVEKGGVTCDAGNDSLWSSNPEIQQGDKAFVRASFNNNGSYALPYARTGLVVANDETLYRGMTPWGDIEFNKVVELDTSALGDFLASGSSFYRAMPTWSTLSTSGSEKVSASYSVVERVEPPVIPPTEEPTEPPTDEPTEPVEPTEPPTETPTETVPPTTEPTEPTTEEPTSDGDEKDAVSTPTESPVVPPATDEPTEPTTDEPTDEAMTTDKPTDPSTSTSEVTTEIEGTGGSSSYVLWAGAALVVAGVFLSVVGYKRKQQVDSIS